MSLWDFVKKLYRDFLVETTAKLHRPRGLPVRLAVKILKDPFKSPAYATLQSALHLFNIYLHSFNSSNDRKEMR